MKKIIHVNQHNIKANHKDGGNRPVITVKTYKSNDYGHEVVINGPSKVIYPEKPLPCGARVWIETYADVEVFNFDDEEEEEEEEEDYWHENLIEEDEEDEEESGGFPDRPIVNRRKRNEKTKKTERARKRLHYPGVSRMRRPQGKRCGDIGNDLQDVTR